MTGFERAQKLPSARPPARRSLRSAMTSAAGGPSIPLQSGMTLAAVPTFPAPQVDGFALRSRPGAVLRPKRAIGRSDDAAEHEADRVADRVVEAHRVPGKHPQARGTGPARAPGPVPGMPEAPAIVEDVVNTPGRPLDEPTRALMEPQFGQDLGHVRLHDDDHAAESARQVNSLAYTVGNHVVLGSPTTPQTPSGRHLLAHELTHVAQSGGSGIVRRAPGGEDEPPEPITTPQRVPYGSTDLSKEALAARRNNPQRSGDYNVVVVRFTWTPTDGTGAPKQETKTFWNAPGTAHSEQVLDQYFRDFKAGKGHKVGIEVTGIFSERQFCGPSGQDCEKLVYKSYPKAKKEFAYNYQMPYGIPRGQGATTKNVIRQRIETFRDSGQSVDESTRRDPPPYSERAGGRLPGQVAPPAAKKSTATPTEETEPPKAAATAPQTAPPKPAPTATTTEPPKPAAPPPTATGQKPSPTAPATTAPPAPTPPAVKPAATSTPPAAKPPAPAPAPAPKPPAPAPKPPAPARKAPPATGKGVPPTGGVTSRAVKGAGGALMTQAQRGLRKILADNPGDKELAEMIDGLDKGLAAKSFISNPKGFIAGTIKDELIQAPFRSASAQLATARSAFEAKFPSVRTLQQNIYDNGDGLEAARKGYEQARAELRKPDQRKALMYLFVLLGLPEDAPLEEVQKRLKLADQHLATLPGIREAYEKFLNARFRYNLALATVTNRINLSDDELAKRPAGEAADLRRRRAALVSIAGVLTDLKDQLWDSGLVIWAPVLGAALDLETLAEGFQGLGGQFGSFADVVGGRRGEYRAELKRIEKEAEAVAASGTKWF